MLRIVLLMGLSFAAGYGFAKLRKRGRSSPVAQNAARALLTIHEFTGRLRPVLEPLAAGEGLSPADGLALVRALG
jgi:hypothetical protein